MARPTPTPPPAPTTKLGLVRALVDAAVRDIGSTDERLARSAWRWLTSDAANYTVATLAPDWYWEFTEVRAHHDVWYRRGRLQPLGIVPTPMPGFPADQPDERICSVCGGRFFPYSAKHVFCSDACRVKAARARKLRVLETPGR